MSKFKKKYYKVVSPDLRSSLQRHLPDNFIVQYKINEWVKSNIPHTKLMVFDEINAARRLLNLHYNTRRAIYEIKVKNPSKKGLFISYIGDLSTYNTNSFMNAFTKLIHKLKSKKQFFQNNGLPSNTVFVKEVKLIKRVY